MIPYCCGSAAKSCSTLCKLVDSSPTVFCPSLSPRLCSNSCPLSQWCYLTISSSATHFSFCLPSFSVSGSFPMSQPYASDGQNIGASASILPMNIQGWFPLGLTGLIFLQSKGLSRVFSSTTVQKHQFFSTQPSLWSSSHAYTTTGKTIALTIRTFISKVKSLLLNMLSRFVIYSWTWVWANSGS